MVSVHRLNVDLLAAAGGVPSMLSPQWWLTGNRRRLQAHPDRHRRRRPNGRAVPAGSDCLSGATWCALLRSATGRRARLATVCA